MSVRERDDLFFSAYCASVDHRRNPVVPAEKSEKESSREKLLFFFHMAERLQERIVIFRISEVAEFETDVGKDIAVGKLFDIVIDIEVFQQFPVVQGKYRLSFPEIKEKFVEAQRKETVFGSDLPR